MNYDDNDDQVAFSEGADDAFDPVDIDDEDEEKEEEFGKDNEEGAEYE